MLFEKEDHHKTFLVILSNPYKEENTRMDRRTKNINGSWNTLYALCVKLGILEMWMMNFIDFDFEFLKLYIFSQCYKRTQSRLEK